MPKDQREPQSYGSDVDWTTGRTGEQVNEQSSTPPPEQSDFYDDRREAESSAPHQGGEVSDVQLAENVEPAGNAQLDEQPVSKVTVKASGAKRGSYFKRRDYE